MIKLTLGELVDAQPVLAVLAQSQLLPFKAAFHVGRVLRKTADDQRAFLEKQNDLIEKYGEPQFETVDAEAKSGPAKPLQKPDGSPLMGINPSSPNWAAFVEALQEVRSTVIECPEINPISIDAMGDKQPLSPAEVATVLWLFKENYDGSAAQD